MQECVLDFRGLEKFVKKQTKRKIHKEVILQSLLMRLHIRNSLLLPQSALQMTLNKPTKNSIMHVGFSARGASC
jgi:hypothetical protein